MTTENTKMEQLLNTFSLERLITAPVYFKSVTPTCIGLTLASHKQFFMKSQAFVTGISDFHALTLTVMRNAFARLTRRLNSIKSLKSLIVKCLKSSFVIPYNHFNG